jgi:hypothetical protein
VVKRLFVAAAAMASVALTLVFFACGGSVQLQVASDDACDIDLLKGDAADAADAAHEAVPSGPGTGVYTGFDPPVPGEYPPNTKAACEYSGCYSQGTCDPQTGWCCSGELRSNQCSCGLEAGCVPPSVCCALPNTLELQCVSSQDECPDAS